ncbi:aspartate/glutamate racemase family protein [Tsuneonella dongtanensis]|uniref:maleate cis-trans isomerase family protein n=1 Tax=Tsuneonella dongtanensis TaxID=692370 RepID=UPI000A07062D|nr:aspartate/glutamate racemase family protein [Tsuneonella dongtanensis]
MEPHGQDARIGLIALSTDLAIEQDFHRLAAASEGDVAVFTTRIPLVTPNTIASFEALAAGLGGIGELLVPESKLDVIVFGCTAASMIIGPERLAARLQEGRREISVTNPASASLAAFKELRIKRIVLATPYTEEVNKRAIEWFERHHIEVVGASGFGSDNDDDHARISAQDWIDAVARLDPRSADGIFLSCTATRALEVIERLENQFNRPVVTSNQAAFWHACLLAGHPANATGFGELLTESTLEPKRGRGHAERRK